MTKTEKTNRLVAQLKKRAPALLRRTKGVKFAQQTYNRLRSKGARIRRTT
jgi:hypothetical protein